MGQQALRLGKVLTLALDTSKIQTRRMNDNSNHHHQQQQQHHHYHSVTNTGRNVRCDFGGGLARHGLAGDAQQLDMRAGDLLGRRARL